MDERKDDTRLYSFEYLWKEVSGIVKSMKFKMYGSDVRHEMDNKYRPFSDTVVAVSVIDALNYGGRMETALKLGKLSLVAGLDNEKIQKDGIRTKNMIKQPGLPVIEEKLWNNAVVNNTGFFAEGKMVMKTWEFIGAARLDLNNATSDEIKINHAMQGEIYHYGTDSIGSEHTNVSFSLAISKILNHSLNLSFAIGRGVRSPDITERFIILLPIGYDKFDYLGNPKLDPEINNQADLTLKYSNEKYGLLQVNGFYSLVNDYITGKRLAPSQQKPLSKDVLGVKQFYNAGTTRFRGFEVSYASPSTFDLGVRAFASYTYGTIDEVNKYILNEQGEVVDDELLKKDALAEIPPMEASLSLFYKMFKSRLVPQFTLRAVSGQNHVSEANYEEESPGFLLSAFSVAYIMNKYIDINAGVNNVFDVAYYEHLNRNIIGSANKLYEPGRSFYLNIKFKF